MKRLLGSVCAAIVIIAAPSFAAAGNLPVQKIAQRNDDQQQGRRGDPQGGDQGQAQQRGNQRQGGRAPGQAIQNQGQQGRGGPGGGFEGRNRAQGQFGGNRPPQVGPQDRGFQGRNPAQGQFGRNQPPQRGRGDFAQGAPNRGSGRIAGPVEHGPSQFERRAFQRNETAPRRFRVGRFRPPPGWQYRHWTYGEYLPMLFWSPTYWITNFWLYDLDRPPVGCEWVRNGPDALLVDISTGEILEVVYDVFY